MKLYYMPGACSLAPHITAKYLGMSLELEKVGRDKVTETGANYLEISPTGAVPLLKLDNGEILTEVGVILQYLCDQSPKGSELLPAQGTMDRVRVQEWLNYVSSEIHKGIGILFGVTRMFPENLQGQVAEGFKNALPRKFDRLEKALKGKKYLHGDKMSVADIYLFVVVSWTSVLGIDISKWPSLIGFMENMSAQSAVRAAQEAEGLGKK